MKLIEEKPPPCPCQHKLWDFYDQAGRTWGIGTMVECDCGQQYVLAEDQRDGKFWMKHKPLLKYKIQTGNLR